MKKKDSKSINFKKEIFNLWNNKKYVKKYNNFKYTLKDQNTYYLNGRRDIVLKYLKKLNLPNNSSILELGYGAGQNAKYFMKFCKKFYGIEISKPLMTFAKKKNIKQVNKGKAKFTVGSIEEKFKIKSNSIDVVIIVGVLQYVISPKKCFDECKRVLKKNGKLIIAQTNTFNINEMVKPRKFLVNCVRIILNQEFQYSHSTTIKSILLETKLKKFFKNYKNTKWINSFFFTSGYQDIWKYKVKRRLLSYSRLKKILKDNNFLILSSNSYPFFFKNNNIVSKIIFGTLDFILVNLNKIFLFSFLLKFIGASNIFLTQKK